jgi:hypothetical protein
MRTRLKARLGASVSAILQAGSPAKLLGCVRQKRPAICFARLIRPAEAVVAASRCRRVGKARPRRRSWRCSCRRLGRPLMKQPTDPPARVPSRSHSPRGPDQSPAWGLCLACEAALARRAHAASTSPKAGHGAHMPCRSPLLIPEPAGALRRDDEIDVAAAALQAAEPLRSNGIAGSAP